MDSSLIAILIAAIAVFVVLFVKQVLSNKADDDALKKTGQRAASAMLWGVVVLIIVVALIYS